MEKASTICGRPLQFSQNDMDASVAVRTTQLPSVDVQKMVKKIDTIFRELIWKGGSARIHLKTLQLQKTERGSTTPTSL